MKWIKIVVLNALILGFNMGTALDRIYEGAMVFAAFHAVLAVVNALALANSIHSGKRFGFSN